MSAVSPLLYINASSVAAMTLLIISQARSEALLLALAAQWLGGSVTLLDPELDNRPLLTRLKPTFVLAEALDAVQQVRSTDTAATGVAVPGRAWSESPPKTAD